MVNAQSESWTRVIVGISKMGNSYFLQKRHSLDNLICLSNIRIEIISRQSPNIMILVHFGHKQCNIVLMALEVVEKL